MCASEMRADQSEANGEGQGGCVARQGQDNGRAASESMKAKKVLKECMAIKKEKAKSRGWQREVCHECKWAGAYRA